ALRGPAAAAPSTLVPSRLERIKGAPLALIGPVPWPQNARPGSLEEAGPARHRSPSLPASSMDQIVNLAKRRGFVFPASEIYGGLNSCWDYGPLGVELKRNIREAWWRSMVRERDDVVGLDASLMTHPRVWVASGHVATFHDPLADCKKCKMRWRVDHIAEGQYGEPKRNAAGELLCPNDG